MDVFSVFAGQAFVWDSEKASVNRSRHGIRFDEARECFLDPLVRFEDATATEEGRLACIGISYHRRLLYVVHVVREGEVIRLISARKATTAERTRYEDE